MYTIKQAVTGRWHVLSDGRSIADFATHMEAQRYIEAILAAFIP